MREAWMRQGIRQAQREGFQRIAVVCGAWHAPALASGAHGGGRSPAKADAELLKGLPRTKVAATWIPWTYRRLAFESGYGAGVTSPGYYDHLWRWPESVTVRWMTRVARCLRDEDLDASAASVIEAVRLAESLAALRDRPLPGLPELNEAAQAVFCFGSDVPMRLIRDQLVVGERLGAVPDEAPAVPLQLDLQRLQKRLRLLPEAAHRDLDLDLRQSNDLERSRLLHRLQLLGIPWGQPQGTRGKGTFRELWRVQWQPELAIDVIRAGIWGNTILDAATAFARDQADKATDLPSLTRMADAVLLADLPDAVGYLMQRVEAQAAVSADVAHLMDALPRVAEMIRYPNVRGTDRAALDHLAAGFVARICIGLPGAASSLDDDAAGELYRRIMAVHGAIHLLDDEAHRAAWSDVLAQLADQQGLHGLIAGRCVWLCLDAGRFPQEEAARRLGLGLGCLRGAEAFAAEPPQAAAWIDGLLRGNAALLIHSDALLPILDRWLSGLAGETFTTLLPLLRRTFATFHSPERRAIGERLRHGAAARAGEGGEEELDEERAARVLPLVRQLLGLGS
jgi:hypothetical protein